MGYAADFQSDRLFYLSLGNLGPYIDCIDRVYPDNKPKIIICQSGGGPTALLDILPREADSVAGMIFYECPVLVIPDYLKNKPKLVVWNNYEPKDKWFFPYIRQDIKNRSNTMFMLTENTEFVKATLTNHTMRVPYWPFRNFAWDIKINKIVEEFIRSPLG